MLSACKIAEVKNDVFNVSGGAANNADFVMEEKSGVPLIEEWLIYAGTNEGLFAVSSFGNTKALWTGGSVKKIISIPGEKESWAMLSGEGILVSHDLINWEKRNQGLPVKTIKIYENGQKSFVNIMQDLKDLEVNPSNPDIMVCTTSERIYLTRNQGQSWTALAAHPYTAHGIKAVASAFLPELTIFMSHSTNGVHYIQPDTAGARWTRLQQGLELLETTSSSDEVSDIVVMQNELSSSHEIYVSQTFKRRIYKLDWNAKAFNLLWSDQSRFGTVDSLYPDNDGLYFLYEGHTAYLDFNGHMKEQPEITSIINSLPSGLKPNCIIIDDAPSASQKILLSELWLLKEPRDISAEIAANREGIYLPVEIALDRNRLDSYIDLMKKAGLNMITIDMKDEDGRLRFTPQNSDVVSKGRVFRPVDIDPFLAEMKQKGIYTVARIVAFKDSVLAANGSGRYSVWDRNNIPWVASNNERWVDPYSEEVWEYIAMISEELCRRGFDEIQFDYIRFPTDGTNLSDARYRWQDTGMDMESAILSFLRHIRPRVKAPISIDIYGSNGFYRTSARTGQDVELLAPWVDVICPMYYPSHWEQWFFAQAPAELRPWRIYYTGTLRNDRIARGQTIIRPWAQAFYLNVSYDRQYYNKDYVRRQIEGMREAGIGGYTYWNILGRYDDITLLE
ncbi:MAG: putative glycoside hydrolase [Treponema sp.]|nr:putative glycoside hydrolase [Treponema sp.]